MLRHYSAVYIRHLCTINQSEAVFQTVRKQIASKIAKNYVYVAAPYTSSTVVLIKVNTKMNSIELLEGLKSMIKVDKC